MVRGSKRFIDDTPYSLQKSYYSMKLVRGTELEGKEKIARGTIRALAEMGYEQSGYRDELVARMPTPEEKRFFKIGPGIPVVKETHDRGWVWLPPVHPAPVPQALEPAVSHEQLIGLLGVLIRQLDQLARHRAPGQ
ncbi:transcriptional regulatory protein [Mycobacterium tuberculosis]|nr:transcriptional regulatory protein [Mycobacterium tuberculosis]